MGVALPYVANAQTQALSGLGSAIQGFAQGMNDADDRRMKQQEFEAKMSAMQTQVAQSALTKAIELKKANLTQGEDGILNEAPMTQREQNAGIVTGAGKGVKVSYDDDGNAQATPDMDSVKYQKLGLEKDRTETMMNLGRQRMGLQQNRFDEIQNQNAVHAGKDIENNPILSKMKGTLNNLDRAQQMLKGNVPINVENFNTLQNDFANAMSPGGVATEGKMNRELVSAFSNKLQELRTKMGDGSVDVRKTIPGLVKQLDDMMTQVHGDYSNAMANQVKDLSGSYKYSTNKKLQNTVGDKVNHYSQAAEGLVAPGLVSGQQGMVQGAAQDSAHPPRMQNGHMYMWNPSTKQYE